MIAMTIDSTTSPRQPLTGVRVLDLSRVLAGPWCTQTLADLGADVIKVERPSGPSHSGGDDTRGWGPPFLKDVEGNDTAEAAYYLACNRGKHSVAIDFTKTEGRDLVLAIAPGDQQIGRMPQRAFTAISGAPRNRILKVPQHRIGFVHD